MKWFHRLSLRKRLLILFILIAMVPLLAFQLVFFQFLQNRSFKQRNDSAQAVSERLAYDYQSLFDRVMLAAENLSNFHFLGTYLDSNYETVYDTYLFYISNIHPMLEVGTAVDPAVHVCVHHGRSNVPVLSSELHGDLDAFLEKYPDLNMAGSWHIGTRKSYEPTSVSLMYLLPVTNHDRYPELDWLIELQVTEAALSEVIRKHSEEGNLSFLTTADGSVLASSNSRYRSNDRVANLKQVIPLLNSAEPPEIVLDGIQYSVFGKAVQGCWVLCLLSAEDIQQEYTRTMVAYLSACLIVIILMILAIRWTADSVTKGIAQLAQKMQSFDGASIKKLAKESTDRQSQNEVDQLNSVFTDMMSNIDHLMNTVGQQEIALRDQIIARQEVEISRIDAESRALQHQINPHYLFNTLEAIRMKLILKDDRETAEIIWLFAESFRRYMEDHDTFVPLQEELEFVEKFMRIQNYRFEDQIHYVCQADPDILHSRILKLVIQPLVENAVLHGLALQDQRGTIRLTIGMEQDRLKICVEDNGVGMTQDELETLNNKIKKKQEQPSSVGLPNIARRVQLVYGNQAELTITSKTNQGTCVKLLIPWKE